MATRVASIVAEIGIDSKKFDTGMKSILGGLTNLKGGFGAASIGIGLAATAAGMASAQMKKAVDITVTYADEVRQLSSITNQSAEETSKMIQVLDDYEISAQQAGAAAKFLAKEGLSLNVETLAKLSDEYKSLNTGQERAEFLMKKFGRAGQDFALTMEQGSDAILKQGDAVNKGLILSDKQLTAARNLKIAQDNLNDSVQEWNVIAGNAAIGPLTTGMKTLNVSLEGLAPKLKLVGDMIMALKSGDIDKWKELGNSLNWASKNDLLKIFPNLAHLVKASSTEAGLAARMMRDLSYEQDKVIEGVIEHAASLDQIVSYGKEYSDSLVSVKQLEADLALAREQKYSETGTKILGIKSALEEAKEASKKATGSMVYDLMQVQMAADGITDPKAFLDLQYALGLIGTEAYNASLQALALGDALRNIPANIRSTVAVFYEQFGYVPSFADQDAVRSAIDQESSTTNRRVGRTIGDEEDATGEANGGSLSDGRFILVGDAPGGAMTPYSELIDTKSGRIYNNKETRALMKMGMGVRSAAQGTDDDYTNRQWILPGTGNLSTDWVNMGMPGAPQNWIDNAGGGSGASSAVINTAVAATRQAAASARESSQLVYAMEKMLRQKSTVSAPVVSLSVDTIRQMASAFAGEVRRTMG